MPLGQYQVLGGLLAAIGLPVLLRTLFNPEAVLTVNYQVTVAAAVVAHLSGYSIYKRLDRFPGTTGFSTILPAFAISYGLVFLVIFFMRLEYSRLQAASSFLISSLWYFGFFVFVNRTAPYRLALISGGEADELVKIDDVVWTQVKSPDKLPNKVHGVVADLRADFPPAWERFITDCVLSGKPVYHVKQVVESLTGRVAIEHLSENTLGSLTPSQIYLVVKRIVDFVMALVVLVLASPLLLALAVAIRLESPGPALFRQKRIGYRGEPFMVFKFRTMRTETDAAVSAREKAITRDGDARITRLGRVLRKTRLDELPQAINVLRGEMSWTARGRKPTCCRAGTKRSCPSTAIATSSCRASPAGRR